MKCHWNIIYNAAVKYLYPVWTKPVCRQSSLVWEQNIALHNPHVICFSFKYASAEERHTCIITDVAFEHWKWSVNPTSSALMSSTDFYWRTTGQQVKARNGCNNRACSWVSQNALFSKSQTPSVNDSIDFEWVILEIPVINCIVGMLLTCPIVIQD